jgi:hypothetical protein
MKCLQDFSTDLILKLCLIQTIKTKNTLTSQSATATMYRNKYSASCSRYDYKQGVKNAAKRGNNQGT